MLNSVNLIGRLTKDPELRYTPGGKAVATMRLAVDRGTKDASGKNEVDFIDCVVWERQAETAANNLNKGRLIGVEGRLQIRQFDTQEGQRREKAEVVIKPFGLHFLDRGDSNQQASRGNAGSSGSAGTEWDNSDEEAPF